MYSVKEVSWCGDMGDILRIRYMIILCHLQKTKEEGEGVVWHRCPIKEVDADANACTYGASDSGDLWFLSVCDYGTAGICIWKKVKGISEFGAIYLLLYHGQFLYYEPGVFSAAFEDIIPCNPHSFYSGSGSGGVAEAEPDTCASDCRESA